jgi:hypothetical protein
MESIAKELQDIVLSDADLGRAVATARPVNKAVRIAADARLEFEDEPAGFSAFLNQR